MMRWFLAFSAILGLLWIFTGDSDAQPQAQNVVKAQLPTDWPREIVGHGKTLELAKEKAVKLAVDRLGVCLKNQNPPLDAWQPDEQYVRDHLLDGEGHEGQLPDNADFAKILKQAGFDKVWVCPVRESPDWADMVQRNQVELRKVVTVQRQTMAGFGLAALTALFATGWGYLRVDEWTRGRFSQWLRIGAVAILAITGAAWWLFYP
jgi:hypothetical protein